MSMKRVTIFLSGVGPVFQLTVADINHIRIEVEDVIADGDRSESDERTEEEDIEQQPSIDDSDRERNELRAAIRIAEEEQQSLADERRAQIEEIIEVSEENLALLDNLVQQL